MRWCWLGLGLLTACPGINLPPEAARPLTTAPSHPDREAAAVMVLPEDLEPPAVDASGPLLVRARWREPATLYPVADPMKVAAVREGAVTLGLGSSLRGLAPLLKLDAPIEVVVIADVETSRQAPVLVPAVSIGLDSLAEALRVGRPRRLAPGVWRVGDEAGPACAVVTAQPARLVCTDLADRLPRLAAHVARHLPAPVNPEAAFRLDVDVKPLLTPYGPRWSRELKRMAVVVDHLAEGHPALRATLAETAETLTAEVIHLGTDLDRLSVELHGAEEGMELEAELRFRGARSWAVQQVLAGEDTTAPEMFGRLPGDSTTAAFGRDDARAFELPAALGARVVAAWLDAQAVGTPIERRQLSGFITRVLPPTASWVSATGLDPRAAPWRARLGFDWYLYGVEERGRPPWVAHLDGVAAVLSRARVREALAEKLDQPIPRLERRGPVRGLPGASHHLVQLVLPLGPRGKKVEVAAHLVVTSNGGETWIGLGHDVEVLARRLNAVRESGPEQLAGRLSLQALSATPAGGFTTLRSMGVPGLAVLSPLLWRPRLLLRAGLDDAPHRGATPLVATTVRHRGDEPGVTWTLSVPPAALEDATHVLGRWLERLAATADATRARR